MKKVLLTILGVAVLGSEVFASAKGEVSTSSKKVSLKVKALVESEVNIEKIGGDEALDILSGNKVSYRVLSNDEKDVLLHFKSKQGKFKLVNKKNPKVKIPYKIKIRGEQNDFKATIDRENSSAIVDKNYFSKDEETREFDFSVSAKPTVKLATCVPGEYSDTITISVKPIS